MQMGSQIQLDTQMVLTGDCLTLASLQLCSIFCSSSSPSSLENSAAWTQ